MPVKKYQRKTQFVDAIQWDEHADTLEILRKWGVRIHYFDKCGNHVSNLIILATYDDKRVDVETAIGLGNWLVNHEGQFSIVSSNIFEENYELVDPNEDFVCGYCCKPVKERVLFCSEECSDKFDEELESD